MPQHIALMGRMRSGKDTVANRLVAQHQYTRLAFADPLKVMALELDPILGSDRFGGMWRLSDILAEETEGDRWEYAKDNYPEVRRTLQRMGQAQRALDPDYWVRLLLHKVDNADKWNLPVAVSDVRYRNEAEALRTRGFRMVRVVRPECETVTAEELSARGHESERGLDRWVPDAMILNAFSVAELNRRTDELLGA